MQRRIYDNPTTKQSIVYWDISTLFTQIFTHIDASKVNRHNAYVSVNKTIIVWGYGSHLLA